MLARIRPMTFRDRIGIDIGRRLSLEDAIPWAARHGICSIDVELDRGANALTTIDAARAERLRASCREAGITLALHTSSAVNVAEVAPYVGEAVDRYLAAYIDAAAQLGAAWIVVHAGYHFSNDAAERMEAGLTRLCQAVAYAETKRALLLLENLNVEPQEAEIHYLAHTFDEWRFYYDRLHSPSFGLSFTANHAHLVPEGVAGFVEALDMARVHEIRLADCHRLGREVHLKPGAGDLDFADLFRRVEAKGFRGRYTCAFGTLEDMLAGREDLVREAEKAGLV